jgi:hypothetical protein
MNKEQFWKLIEEHVEREGDELHVEALESALAQLPLTEIVDFDKIFQERHVESYSWRLWGAAYLINDGCSEDEFDEFRAWLIGAGRQVYERALKDPDSLASVAAESGELLSEDLLFVASEAYAGASDGEELPQVELSYPEVEESWEFDDEEEMRRRYPKLAARYLDG